MSVSLIFDATGVTCVYAGSSGMGQMLDAMNSIGKHDRLKKFEFVLHDFSDITHFEYNDYATVMTAAQLEACLSANRKIKFAIVSEDAHGKFTGQLLSDLLKRQLHVFTSVALAMVWLRSF